MLQVHFKGGILMRVAISTDGDYVSEHFGRCPNFTVLDWRKERLLKGNQLIILDTLGIYSTVYE
jgi:hypothetical protein